MTLGRFRIQDSSEHLPAALQVLADDLKAKPHHPYRILKQMSFLRQSQDPDQGLELLKVKGVFPYEYGNSLQEWLNTPSLPNQDAFYSSLTDGGISDEEYAHAQRVFQFFNMNHLSHYCSLYCATDTYLLAEILFEYRRSGRAARARHPVHHILPVPGWCMTTSAWTLCGSKARQVWPSAPC